MNKSLKDTNSKKERKTKILTTNTITQLAWSTYHQRRGERFEFTTSHIVELKNKKILKDVIMHDFCDNIILAAFIFCELCPPVWGYCISDFCAYRIF